MDPTGGKPSVSIEGFIPQARPDYFDISVKTGRGEVFPLSVHSGLKVKEVHKLIASRPDSECSAHAMRLVYASKVISHEQESQLSKFEVKEGDVFSMVVVRPLPTPLTASTQQRRSSATCASHMREPCDALSHMRGRGSEGRNRMPLD